MIFGIKVKIGQNVITKSMKILCLGLKYCHLIREDTTAFNILNKNVIRLILFQENFNRRKLLNVFKI